MAAAFAPQPFRGGFLLKKFIIVLPNGEHYVTIAAGKEGTPKGIWQKVYREKRVIFYRKTQFTVPNIVCKERLVNDS